MTKDRVNISKTLVEDAFKYEWATTLHYYILIRKLYKTPHIYNYSCRKLSKLTGVSTSVISHHIKIMLEKGIAYVHNGNLCFKSQTKVNAMFGRRKTIINLQFHKNKTRMLDELRSVILIQNLNNQKTRISKGSEIVKKCKAPALKLSKKELKYLTKHGGEKQLEKSINRRVTLSNKKFGSLFKRSQYSGILYQKRLNQMGVIKSSQKIEIISDKFHPEMMRYALKGFFRTKNNEFAKQLSNTIWSPYMVSYDELLEKHKINYERYSKAITKKSSYSKRSKKCSGFAENQFTAISCI